MTLTHVLLVEDDEKIRRIGELSLSRVGRWSVAAAASGPEALALARARRPDVILLDVMMPGMDGPTVLAKLRADEATSSIPVIFLTAKIQRHQREHYVSLGAAGVIAKPFDPLTLPHDIQQILEVVPAQTDRERG